jgi:catechol 2,3-dioxygenase-like lactoylglutathione lyase family enzyme
MTRSDATKPRFEAVTLRIPVQDIEAALTFYRNQLGFDLGWTWGTPVTHANVCRDSISFDLRAAPAARRGTAMAYIQVNRVDAHYSEPRARGVSLNDLGDREYGMRDL